MWWFTLSLLLCVLFFFSSSFSSQTGFWPFQASHMLQLWKCSLWAPHAEECSVQNEYKTCSDFVAQLRVFTLLFFSDILTVRYSCSSQSFRDYYKWGFQAFILFFILLWKLGFLWHPSTRHKLILLRMYCMCVKWQSVKLSVIRFDMAFCNNVVAWMAFLYVFTGK